MKQDSKPLWQRLNEERTLGKWEWDGFTIAMGFDLQSEIIADFNPKDTTYPTVGDRDEKECLRNAAYSAFAVNNLHILAKTLKAIAECDGMNVNESDARGFIKMAKEALNKIS